MTDAKMLLIGAKAFQKSSVQFANQLGKVDGIEALAASAIAGNTVNANRFLDQNFSGMFIDILASICPRADFCYALTDAKMPIYWDNTHLTRYGAEFFGRTIIAGLLPSLAK